MVDRCPDARASHSLTTARPHIVDIISRNLSLLDADGVFDYNVALLSGSVAGRVLK